MIASHVGRETDFEALGRTWRASRWTRRTWAEFLEWARPRIPDPMEVLLRVLPRLPAEDRADAVRYAIDRGGEYLSVGSYEVLRALSSVEGMNYLFYLLLRPAHPEMTEDMAFEIAASLPEGGLKNIFDRAQGKMPRAAEGNAPAPAAE